MPRVIEQTKSTRGRERTCGRCGRKIRPGERYLQWSFRYGGTHYRCIKHRPRQSELTQSKMSEVYSAIEGAEDDLATTKREELGDLTDQVAETVREITTEYEEAAEPFGGEGENAERAQDLDGWADELDNARDEIDQAEDDDAARELVSQVLGECPL